MAFFISTLLFLSVILGGAKPAVSQSSDQSEPMCDWGELGEVLVVEGEVGWLSCPLFSRPSLYNYSAAQSAGHNLIWYRVPAGHDLEEPIERSQRLSKERDRLWLQPAAAEDTGQYICMLRNKSSCAKIAMRLKVLSRDAASEKDCQPPVAVAPSQVVIPLQGGKTLECPDLQDVAKMADSSPRVTWYHRCEAYPFGTRQVVDREQKGSSLVIHMMVTSYQGLYSCTVNYSRGGEPLHYSRSLNVTAVNPRWPQDPIALSKLPFILKPTKAQTFPVRRGGEVRLTCRGVFPYLEDERREIWWTIDGKTVEELADARFSKSPTQQVFYDFGDRTEESLLLIQDIQPEDLKREYNCSVRNPEGFDTRRARLEEEESLQVVPLACGLGVTLLLMLALFVVYHVFWLELLLLYRSWFGTDERYTDDKEFDIYISYARNSEEEQFVLTTLRGVLENELGYSVCIFDRDSLPGGTITDETLSFVARSRRLLVVVSPGYASQGSQALLELKAGIDGMALGGHLRVILVQYRAVRRQGWVRELRRARLALALVRWQGDKSKELTSHFWKRLRVELPVRRVAQGQEGGQEDLTLRKLQSQSSTSSQTGLITNSVKQPHAVLNSAAGL